MRNFVLILIKSLAETATARPATSGHGFGARFCYAYAPTIANYFLYP
jgi:hypothetical protein